MISKSSLGHYETCPILLTKVKINESSHFCLKTLRLILFSTLIWNKFGRVFEKWYCYKIHKYCVYMFWKKLRVLEYNRSNSFNKRQAPKGGWLIVMINRINTYSSFRKLLVP